MDINRSDRTRLKSYFAKNAVPTASNFAELIDGAINQKEDGIAKIAGQPLAIQAEGDDAGFKTAINFYRSFADAKAAWTLSLNGRANPTNAATSRAGWSLGDGDGNSRLFIDQATGNIGVAVTDPGGYKLNVNGSALFTGNYLYANAENAGRLRVGAAWGKPGLYSGDDGAKSLMLGAPVGQKIYLGQNQGDASIESGSGNAWFKGNVGIGPGATQPAGKLDVFTGGNSGWDRFVVTTTGLWGDANAQHVTIGAGGATGVMLRNPHVVWYAQENRASIRMGRSGGAATGQYWDIGVRLNNAFSIVNPDANVTALMIDGGGNIAVGGDNPAGYRLNVNGSALVTGNYLYVNSESAGRLRVGAAWGMPGLYSSDDGAKPLVLGVPSGQRVYLGVSSGDAYVEGGTGHAWFKGTVRSNTGAAFSGIVMGVTGNAGVNLTQWPYESIGVNATNYNLRLCSTNSIYFHPGNNGNAVAGVLADGSYWRPSDRALKKDIAPIEEALRTLLRLRGVSFAWREPGKQGAAGGRQLGVIAQEVEQVFPEWVAAMPDGTKGVGFSGFEGLVVEAIRELAARCEALAAQLARSRGAEA